MITHLFKKRKELDFERSYPAPRQTVWRAWTDAAGMVGSEQDHRAGV